MDKKELDFFEEVKKNIDQAGTDKELYKETLNWMIHAGGKYKYSYNFTWFGRPIIQYPQDMVAMQELIWLVQPDLIIETGIAHGGSLIFSASMLELNSLCGGNKSAEVVGIDIEIRSHNRKAIEDHPLSKRIVLLEGSSVASGIIAQVKAKSATKSRVLVFLDSNHTHEHVLAELEAYAPLTSLNSYCVVFDTVIEETPPELMAHRPWGKGNSPKTAVWEYLRRLKEKDHIASDGKVLQFEIDKRMENKLLITAAPSGYLKRIDL